MKLHTMPKYIFKSVVLALETNAEVQRQNWGSGRSGLGGAFYITSYLGAPTSTGSENACPTHGKKKKKKNINCECFQFYVPNTRLKCSPSVTQALFRASCCFSFWNPCPAQTKLLTALSLLLPLLSLSLLTGSQGQPPCPAIARILPWFIIQIQPPSTLDFASLSPILQLQSPALDNLNFPTTQL